MSRSRASLRRGFTLVEVIVSSILIAGIASAVTISTSQALRAARISEARQSAFMRADAAVQRIARDVRNVVRNGDLFYTRVLVIDEHRSGVPRDELLVFAATIDTVRPNSNSPEGGSAEIQYRAAEAPTDPGDRSARRSRLGAPPQLQLWRRVDPIPDDNPLGGGVVFPVVRGVTSLSIEAFDGEAWASEWDSDRDGCPHAVRIIVTAVSRDGERTVTARKVVALDRVPPTYDVDHTTPPADEEEDA